MATPASFYQSAKAVVLAAGYGSEIDSQRNAAVEPLSPELFLREAAWVIINSGFRETVCRDMFPRISCAFFEWRSVHQVVAAAEDCRLEALAVLRNRRKIDAIIHLAKFLIHTDFDEFIRRVRADPVRVLSAHPMLGPATSRHLAKNIGIQMAKPDRHLVRMAKALGFLCVQHCCSEIAEQSGDSVSVVDVVLWRYAVIRAEHGRIGMPARCRAA